MNLLTSQLPDRIEIDGQQYKLNTGFRTCLRIIYAFEDNRLTIYEKFQVMLENLYDELPSDLNRAVELGTKFLNFGEKEKDDGDDLGPRVFSFEHDGNLIFAAFQQTHGIDLSKIDLHWWQFMALFMDLGSETAFCQLISFRKRIKDGTASKEEQKEYRMHRELYDLPEPDLRTTEELLAAENFFKLVGKPGESK